MKDISYLLSHIITINILSQKKINLNNNLLETIKVLRQDENNLKDENDAYEIALKLIKKRLKEEYRR